MWKILKAMGIPEHLTCLLRNLYAGQEATVRTGHGTTDWFQVRKGVHQGYILSPCFFNLYAEYISYISRVIIYSLDVLLFLFGTSLLVHVQLLLLLPDLHTGFSRSRSGGLVFLSLSEFSTFYCDPHSRRLSHSQ